MTEPDPVVRHFLVCRRVKFDLDRRYAPYSAENVLYRYRPARGYPAVIHRIWTFVTVVGSGSCEFWIDVAYRGPLDSDPDETTPADVVASYGPYVVHFGVAPALLTRGWSARAVPFDHPGWYDFQLRCRGVLLAVEPIELED